MEAQEPKKKKEKKPLGLFDTKNEPRKGLQTFLRNQNKLHVSSFNIIDKKAAIMIRVNSTIISAIVIFFNKIEIVPYGATIGLVLIISCFLSLIFALNASRPHFFSKFFLFKRSIKRRNIKPEERIFMMGAASDLTEEDYEIAFNKIVQDQKLQIGNQVRTMYMFEKHIKASFVQIEISYLAFMLGFVATVFLFVLGNCNF